MSARDPVEDTIVLALGVILALAVAGLIDAQAQAPEPTEEPAPALLESTDDSADTGAGELPWA